MTGIFSVIHPGMAFLILVGVMVIFVAGLLASGIVSIKIERVDDDKDEDEKKDKK